MIGKIAAVKVTALGTNSLFGALAQVRSGERMPAEA